MWKQKRNKQSKSLLNLEVFPIQALPSRIVMHHFSWHLGLDKKHPPYIYKGEPLGC